jgi:acetolactate synthase-1/2/3 large subunit
MPNGAELFITAALELGIDTVFTLVGDHLNEVLIAAARAGMKVVDLRHESAVAHAADAWARIHRRPALSLVTGGPGHTNSLTGIATANLAGSPLIAVSGSRPRNLADRQAFQDIDQVGMARPVVKWAAEIPSATEIPFYLKRAYREADSGRRGAVHLTIPADVFREEGVGNRGSGVRESAAPAAPNVDVIQRAIELLRGAERPVIIAGSGVWWSGAEEALRKFAELTSAPLYTLTLARGSVSDEHPLVMGYADPALNRAAYSAFQQADVVLVAGKRIDYRLAFGGSRLFSASAKFIQIDIHSTELGMNRALEVAIWADARIALESMCEAAGAAWTPRPWLQDVRQCRDQWHAKLAAQAMAENAGNQALHPAAFFHELAKALPRDVLYSWDGGDFAHWGRAMLPALHAGGWLRLGPMGAIGSSLPNGLALQLANAGRPVAIITGDGALGFYLAEMDSLVRHKLPAVLMVGSDAGWGLERELQSQATGGSTVACELSYARYEQVMRAFGGAGEAIERVEEIAPAVTRAFSAGVPYCLNVKIRGARSPFTEWQIAGRSSHSSNKEV